MKTTVIYSKENDTSVEKVAKFRKRHSHFVFVEVSDTLGVEEAKAGVKYGDKIIELDAAKVVKNKAKKKATKKKK